MKDEGKSFLRYLLEVEHEMMKDFKASPIDVAKMSLIDLIYHYNRNVEDKVNKIKAQNNPELFRK